MNLIAEKRNISWIVHSSEKEHQLDGSPDGKGT